MSKHADYGINQAVVNTTINMNAAFEWVNVRFN